MTFDPEQHHRRTIRWRGYDYSQAGIYFLTICSFRRNCIFGAVENQTVILNAAGWIVREEWLASTRLRAEVELGGFVIMPNHLHALVGLVTNRRGPQSAPNKARNEFRSPSRTIGSLVRGFKGAAARRIRGLWREPQANVWQRNYYEHVVRNAREYDAICRYIQENPQRWEFDENNPARFS